MADKKISDLPVLGANAAVGDLFEMLDVSDTSESAQGTNKSVTQAQIVGTPAAAVVTYDDSGVPITATEVQAAVDQAVFSDIAVGGAGSAIVNNIVQISQTDFDLLTPDANTFYVINGP